MLDVKEHPFFERRGADLYCTIPVSIAQAALGTDLPVPGLNGEERLKIPEGTQSGAVFRIKGHGLPDPRGGGKGDLYYHVRVLTPVEADARAAQTDGATGRDAESGKQTCRTRFVVLRQGERYFWIDAD